MEEQNSDKFESTEEIRAGFRQTKDRRRAFEIVLRDQYENMRKAQSPTEDYIARSLNALYGVLSQPDLISQELLIKYIAEIVRFVENAGLGLEFGKKYIDKAIDIYLRTGYSPIDLYLVKANLLRLDKLEDPERETALQDARKYAQATNNKEDQIKVLVALAEYYLETSRYKKSIQVCHDCEKLIRDNSQLKKHLPEVLTRLGMNYTILLNLELAKANLLQALELAKANLLQAKGHLERNLVEQDEQGENGNEYSSERIMATTLHYLGRIAAAKGNLEEAMTYYIEGNRYQQMCPEELSATAFYHLRLGELLISASLLDQARDHLQISQELFDKIHYSSSGRVQVAHAWATIYSKKGDYKRAKEYIIRAIEDARKRGFSRGQLLCSVDLFWLELKHFHILHTLNAFLQAMKTWYRTELLRGEGFFLLGKYLFQVVSTTFKLLWHSQYFAMKSASLKTSLSKCVCPMHITNNEGKDL